MHAQRVILRHEQCHVAGGMSEGITALQRLARLRLQDVLSAPLTDAVSVLTNLTSLGLFSQRTTCLDLLPAAAAALTGVQQLDVSGIDLPPALEALTGMHVQQLSIPYRIVHDPHGARDGSLASNSPESE